MGGLEPRGWLKHALTLGGGSRGASGGGGRGRGEDGMNGRIKLMMYCEGGRRVRDIIVMLHYAKFSNIEGKRECLGQ